MILSTLNSGFQEFTSHFILKNLITLTAIIFTEIGICCHSASYRLFSLVMEWALWFREQPDPHWIQLCWYCQSICSTLLGQPENTFSVCSLRPKSYAGSCWFRNLVFQLLFHFQSYSVSFQKISIFAYVRFPPLVYLDVPFFSESALVSFRLFP